MTEKIFFVIGCMCLCSSVFVCVQAQILLNRCLSILRWIINEKFGERTRDWENRAY